MLEALSREHARALDGQDELGELRDRFWPVEDSGLVAYLDGNSLGRPTTSTVRRLDEFLRQEWGSRLIRGWGEGWFELPETVGDRLGEVALGAASGQVVVGDSTTVCLYKLLRTAISARPGRTEIVTDVDNFPTDRYIVESVAEELGLTVRWLKPDPDLGVTPDELSEVLGPQTSVVTLSHVAYKSAYIAELEEITRRVHEVGALVVWDLCHSAGCVPVELDAHGVDFAVGCTYKYLNGGPGAPAFMYVRAEHQDLCQPIPGWMGRYDPFTMAQGYEPATGVRSFLSGTPSVVAMIGVAEGTELVAEAGIHRIRRKAVDLTEYAVELADAWLAPRGITVASPRDPQRRGGHVTLRRADAADLSKRLIEAGVIVDFREPDGIRLGLSPLSTSFEELWNALAVVREMS